MPRLECCIKIKIIQFMKKNPSVFHTHIFLLTEVVIFAFEYVYLIEFVFTFENILYSVDKRGIF